MCFFRNVDVSDVKAPHLRLEIDASLLVKLSLLTECLRRITAFCPHPARPRANPRDRKFFVGHGYQLGLCSCLLFHG